MLYIWYRYFISNTQYDQFLGIEVKVILYSFSDIANTSLQKRSLIKIIYGKCSLVYFEVVFYYKINFYGEGNNILGES